MDDDGASARLFGELTQLRDAVVVKLEGLDEYDVRRPLTPTGTNLLGLVKHLAVWESRYLGHVFGRPFPEALPAWDDRAARGSDTWVRADESRADVLALSERVAAHSAATVAALPPDAVGRVPWWRPSEVSLSAVLLHLVVETSRHAGHADILREGLDGTVGSRRDRTSTLADDAAFWRERHERVEREARRASGRPE